jgi:hypothetical protein
MSSGTALAGVRVATGMAGMAGRGKAVAVLVAAAALACGAGAGVASGVAGHSSQASNKATLKAIG